MLGKRRNAFFPQCHSRESYIPNLNVVNVVSLAQIVEGFNEGGAVVCDGLTKSAPSAKNIVEYPITDSLRSLSAKNVILGIVHERAAALDQVFEAAGFRKVHRIHIHLRE